MHYSKITQKNRKVRAEVKQGFANPVFYGGALFLSLLLAGTAALWFYKWHLSLNKRSPDNTAASPNQTCSTSSSSSSVHRGFSQFEPNAIKETQAVGVCWAWARCAEDLGKGQFPQMCWLMLLCKAATPCWCLPCVTLGCVSYLQKECLCLSSDQEMLSQIFGSCISP